MQNGQIALLLRTFLLYPASGFLAAYYGFITFDEATGQLTIDVNSASIVIGLAIWTLVSGGTFAWSRVVKKHGGAT